LNKRARGRARPPMWPRIAVIAAALVVAALVVVFVVRLATGALNRSHTGGASGRDPQFAEPAEAVTRPPELIGETGAPGAEGDPSEHWDLGEQTPVDKTAEELSREAELGR